jgi:hypothetical protein
MLHEIETLREIARRCLAGQSLDDRQSKWLGDSLEKFLDQSCQTIEEALGLRTAKGGVPWWMEEAIRKRDRALCRLAELHCVEYSRSAQARLIHTLSVRYAASAWRFDRTRQALPQRYRDTPAECLWRAFKSGAAMPIGERQLRTILAGVQELGTKATPYGLNPTQARAR